MWYTIDMKHCKQCETAITTRQEFYCSNRCQIDYQYQKHILAWKADSDKGIGGRVTKNVSKHIKRYLFETTKEKCSLCKWSKCHPTTGKIPLEVDHIDGNAENNHINNLRLLCPNCHALTPHFRNLNKGNGRKWRR